MDPNHHNAEDGSRGLFNFQSQQRASEASRPSYNNPLSPSQSHQSSGAQFSIPTNSDSLSSGFHYDTRLRQYGVTNEEWRQFTNEVVNEAKLSLEDDKVAWGAGIATGTAGSALMLLLGPVAGYYTGKAVHKRTVVEKVKERLLEDGQMSRVLRRWNGGTWAQKGFHTWIELPDQSCSVRSGDDAKRFRILVIPGVENRPVSHLSRPTSSGEPLSQQTSLPQKRPVPPLPTQSSRPSTPVTQGIQNPSVENLPAHNPLQQNYPPSPPPRVQSPAPRPSTPKQQTPNPPTQIPIEQKFEYPPPPPIPLQQTQKPSTPIATEQNLNPPPPPPPRVQSPVSHIDTPVQQKQEYVTHTSPHQKNEYQQPTPTEQPINKPQYIPYRPSSVEPSSYQQSSIPHRASNMPAPLFSQSNGHSNYSSHAQRPAAENLNYPPPPPLPAKPTPMNNQVYEMPSNESQAVFELPGNQGVAELPPGSVYEMDGESVPQNRR